MTPGTDPRSTDCAAAHVAGGVPVSTAELGVEYLRRGLQPILYPSGQKGTEEKGWPDRRLTTEEIAAANGSNIGILTGAASGGLSDVDHDCPEALVLAPSFLPGTDCVFGRPSKPSSHRLYLCDPIPKHTEFKDTDGTMLLELRTDRHQTMAPPSLHPSGERVAWERFGEPARLAGDALMRSCSEVAAAAILARHFPVKGSRHDWALALAGFLIRGGWDVERTAWLIVQVARAGGSTDPEKHGAAAESTARKIADGDEATGGRRLGELIGVEVVQKVRGWLGIEGEADSIEADVERELRSLRVRAEARRRLAAETVERLPFDAALLADVVEEPIQWRAEGLLARSGRMLVTAQRKVGKTTYDLNFARDVIRGGLFLGRFRIEPVVGQVAIFNFEVAGAQCAAWAREARVPADRLLLVNLRGRRNPFADDDDTAQLAALLRQHAVEVVIVDPFGRAFPGQNQNDAAEVGSWLCKLDRFAEAAGCSEVILTAHSGWDAERTRGSTALEDWADTIVTLVRDKENPELRYFRAVGRDVQVDEDNLLFDAASRRLTLAGTGSRTSTRAAARMDELVAAVVEAVTREPGATTGRLGVLLREAGVGLQRGDANHAARAATEAGKIIRVSGSRGSFRHFLPGENADQSRPVPTSPGGNGPTSPDPSYRDGTGGGHVEAPLVPEGNEPPDEVDL